MKKEWIVTFAVAFVIAFVCTGCKVVSEPDPIAVQSVTIDKTTLTLAPGEVMKLTADVRPWNADNKTVTWSSSDTWVATVDYYDGKVTAVAEGTATVTARAGGKTATCEVTVKRQAVVVDSITLDKEALTLEVGKTEKLTATVTPDNADDKTVTWSSSDTSVATVSDYGTVTAVAEGTASITAKAGGKQATCAVTVKPRDTTGHTHYFGSGGVCSTCGLPKPSMKGGTIDDYGRLTKYTGNNATVVIPYGVTNIGISAFDGCTSLTSVTIPSSVTSIGSGAFSGCTSLESVEIPDSVTNIWSSAFSGCTNLTSVTIPSSVTDISIYAFYLCTNLTEIQFKGTKEQWNAIKGSDKIEIPCIRCSDGHIGVLGVPTYLKVSGTEVTGYTGTVPATVVIPDGVTSIRKGAFYNNKDIEYVDIPDSVTSIGDNSYETGTFEGCVNLKIVMLPDSVTSIGSNTFKGCTSLVSVTIPKSVTSIGYGAFYRCTSLETVTYKSTLADWCAIDCESTGNPLCNEKAKLYIDGLAVEDAEIPNGVTEIKDYAFYMYTSLASVTIPDSVTSIGNSAFRECKNLIRVTYKGTLDEWCGITWGVYGNPLGYGKANLYINDTLVTNIEIPSSVTEIKSWAFHGCMSLTSVKIPDSVMIIGGRAFSGCDKLTTITYDGTEEQWNTITKGNGYGLSGKEITGKDGSKWTAQ